MSAELSPFQTNRWGSFSSLSWSSAAAAAGGAETRAPGGGVLESSVPGERRKKGEKR